MALLLRDTHNSQLMVSQHKEDILNSMHKCSNNNILNNMHNNTQNHKHMELVEFNQ